jgi:4-alpha-glucanotransferase
MMNSVNSAAKDEALVRLGAACGIQPSYWDLLGNRREISPEVLRELLTALGVDPEKPEEVLRQIERGAWTRLAEPVLVESVVRPPQRLLFTVPTAGEPVETRLDVIEEGGHAVRHSHSRGQLTLEAENEIDGVPYRRWSLPFPAGLPVGLHRFHLMVVVDEKRYGQEISVIVCPERAYLPPELAERGKRAGIAVALYGLRSQRNWGIGDFSDLKEFVSWAVRELRVDVIGLNPLHALSNRQPYGISPYYPISRFYRNFIYLDVEAIEDYRHSPEAQAFVEARDTQDLLARLRTDPLVQYEQVAAVKRRALELGFESFRRRESEERAGSNGRRQAFVEYLEKEGEMLERFATFCALSDLMRERHPEAWTWRQWPEAYQDPDSEAVATFRCEHVDRILFHQYLQWQVEIQVQEVQALARSLGACLGLYHDLALGSDPAGADSWAYRPYWVNGVTVGAPPDDFALTGQDWGFEPPRRDVHRRNGYRLFLEEARKNCAAGGALRIDHIMRFFRLFWIPQGKPPAAGAYVEDFPADLVRILSLASQQQETLIIGEDLGTVAPGVREALQGYGIFSYKVFYFEKDERGDFREPESYPGLALATVSTHDLPTLAGFWRAEDIYVRKRVGMFPDEKEFELALERRTADKEKILQRLAASGLLEARKTPVSGAYPELTRNIQSAVIGLLMSSAAKLVVVSQEDLFRDTRQQNVPGTIAEYPSWSMKMAYTVEELRQDRHVGECARMFRRWVIRTGRASSLSTDARGKVVRGPGG